MQVENERTNNQSCQLGVDGTIGAFIINTHTASPQQVEEGIRR